MKTDRTIDNDEDDMLPEYDFTQMGPGVRGKYYDRYRAGTNLARLAPEIREAFPTDEAVNDALRAVLKQKHPA